MKPIHIDFAPPSLVRVILRTRPAAAICAAAGIALCISAAIFITDLRQNDKLLQRDLHRLSAQVAERTASRTPARVSAVSEFRAIAVNDAVAQLNLPWRDLLDAIEAATPDSVAVLTIEPNARRRFVKGVAEAKTSDQMIMYIEQLKKEAFFEAVMLTKHEVNEQDPHRPIRFQFEAQWAEAAR